MLSDTKTNSFPSPRAPKAPRIPPSRPSVSFERSSCSCMAMASSSASCTPGASAASTIFALKRTAKMNQCESKSTHFLPSFLSINARSPTRNPLAMGSAPAAWTASSAGAEAPYLGRSDPASSTKPRTQVISKPLNKASRSHQTT